MADEGSAAAGGAADGCIFCRIFSGALPARVVYEDEEMVGFLDHRPLFPGHVLVSPRRHIETTHDTPPELAGRLFQVAQLVAGAVEEALGAEGTFLAVNNVVSQTVAHLHIHVVPRTRGDGLRGFFWPRNPYRDNEHADDVQRRLSEAIARRGAERAKQG